MNTAVGVVWSLDNIVQSVNSSAIDVLNKRNFTIDAVWDVKTLTAKLVAASAVNTTSEQITSTAHGFYTGQKGQFTTSSALPGGLSTSTDYFIIKIDANTYAVASSLVNANAGTAINLTTQGTGNHTFTPTAIAGGTIKGQRSNDAVVWYDDTDLPSQTISADGGFMFTKVDCGYAYVRLAMALTAGEVDIDATLSAKG